MRFKVATTRSYIANDLKLWVGSQSHKGGCLCSTNSNRKVRRFGTACGCVYKYTRSSIRFMEKSIVNTFLFSEFVALRIVQVKSSPVFLLWNWTHSNTFIGFLESSYLVFFTFPHLVIWLFVFNLDLNNKPKYLFG